MPTVFSSDREKFSHARKIFREMGMSGITYGGSTMVAVSGPRLPWDDEVNSPGCGCTGGPRVPRLDEIGDSVLDVSGRNHSVGFSSMALKHLREAEKKAAERRAVLNSPDAQVKSMATQAEAIIKKATDRARSLLANPFQISVYAREKSYLDSEIARGKAMLEQAKRLAKAKPAVTSSTAARISAAATASAADRAVTSSSATPKVVSVRPKPGWMTWNLRVARTAPWKTDPLGYEVQPIPGSYFAYYRKRGARTPDKAAKDDDRRRQPRRRISGDMADLYREAAKYGCYLPNGITVKQAKDIIEHCRKRGTTTSTSTTTAKKKKAKKVRRRGPHIRQAPSAPAAPRRIVVGPPVASGCSTLNKILPWAALAGVGYLIYRSTR